ncbi:Pentatricopeptide repeat-containing protein [Platanthera guangdongensis]|uniref:Pentatricopeptide repeat-containing protein n=1 Tax=Platanthera guangdongensis TaxID=2320717 RepID=A0ABR2M4F9_9ASPA
MSPDTHTSTAGKHYFYYGHRRPSRNLQVIFGGLFTNRKTLPSSTIEGDPLSSGRQKSIPLLSPPPLSLTPPFPRDDARMIKMNNIHTWFGLKQSLCCENQILGAR